MQDSLFQYFFSFGLAGLIGFAIGLERAMAGSENPHAGTRDFIMFPLIGAVSGYVAELFGNSWLIVAGFTGFLTLLISGYWIDRDRDSGITTEVAAILSFFLGVLIINGAVEIAIALAIGILAILSQKKTIHTITANINTFELQAALKFLIITFVVLPVLPGQPVSQFITVPLGRVISCSDTGNQLDIELEAGRHVEAGEKILLYDDRGRKLGEYTVDSVVRKRLVGRLENPETDVISPQMLLKQEIDIPWLNTILSALNPYKIWLIVVLVSMISLVGYVLVKFLGPGAGTSLTGLIGGLASSTVTTASFARRSLESPELNKSFAVAVLLASSIMFPRLLLEIAIVNPALMKNMAAPIVVMGGTGMMLAGFFFLRSRTSKPEETTSMQLDNPFCLKSAVSFGIVFACILILTRLATAYLGNRWLPLVSVVSGLVDADAIAFSLSSAQKDGIITLDWASFNLVLGAMSNTFVKLFLVFTMGHRHLFRQLSFSFLIIGAAGIMTTLLYYDLNFF